MGFGQILGLLLPLLLRCGVRRSSSSECNLQIVVSDDVDLLALASPK